MDTTLTMIASAAQYHIHNVPGDMLIYVDGNDRGCDLALTMLKLQMGTSLAGLTIPYDHMPTYASNPLIGSNVFIVSEGQHISTITVTRTPDFHGDMQVFNNRDIDRIRWEIQTGQQATSPIESSITMSDKMMKERKTPDPFKIVIVDAAEPEWGALASVIDAHTIVRCTSRVKLIPELTNTPIKID